MALDLGNLTAGIVIDTDDAFAKLNALDGKVKDVERSTRQLDGSKVDVAPQGADKLDKAAGSAQKLAGELDKAGSEADQLGREMGDAGSRGSSAMSTLKSAVADLAPKIGAAAAAQQIFTRGWNRLESIDTAQAKLRGLGHEADSVSSIMGSALASVKGTAYGLGDAVTAAAGSVAATGATGEDLTRTLTTIADTAAIAGVGMDEMGAIFNKVATSNKIQAEELSQLSDRGIPVLQNLASYMGITAEEVRDLASDGKIGFETFRGAMEASLGGSAVEMGTSVRGSLDNVGAAVGRLGAAAMGGGFNALPETLGSVTSAIDGVTDAVSVAVGAWDSLPGPVKTVIGLLSASKAMSMALDTQLGQKMSSTLTDLVGNFGKLGASAKASFGEMGQAYQTARAPLAELAEGHRFAASAAQQNARTSGDAFTSIDNMGQQAAHGVAGSFRAMQGHVAGTFGAMRNGAGQVVDFFGGPFNIALMGASYLLADVSSANRSLETAQKNMEASTRDAAAAQEDLRTQLAGTTGALDDQALATSARIVKAELAELVELGGRKYSVVENLAQATTGVDELASKIPFLTSESSRAALEQNKHSASLRDTYKALADAMGDIGMDVSQVNEVVAQGGPVYDDLIANLRGMGDEGNRAADDLQSARAALEANIEAARQVSPSYAEAADAMGILADEASSADQKLDAMRRNLELMGIISSEPTDALMELGEALQKVADHAAGVDPEMEGLGQALFNAEGGLDHTNEAARNLHEQLRIMSDEMMLSAQAGVDANETWAEMQPVLQELADAYGIPIEQMQELAHAAGAAPDEVNLMVGIEGTHEVTQELNTIRTELYGLEEGATTTVSIDGDTAAILQDMGYQLEDLGNGNWEVTVSADADTAALDDFLGKAIQLDNEEIHPSVLLDTSQMEVSADEARYILDELNINNPSPQADLIIDSLLSNKSISMSELAILANESPTPVADLNKSLLDSGVLQAHQSLDGVGIRHEKPKVEVNIGNSLAQIGSVMTALTRLPARKYVEVVTRAVGSVFSRNAEGGLAGLAGGGTTHGGYRLPMSGPGTGRTDGILGVDQYGVPTSWVDRGEFVTNRRATEKWEDTLWAINRDDPAAVAASLGEHLQRLETGGRVLSAEEIKAELGHMNGGRYVMGGFNESSIDCSGAVSATVNTALGLPTFESRMSTVTQGQWLAAKGFQPGPGDDDDIVVGWYDYGGGANGHTAMRLQDGTYIESGGNTGQGFTIGGPAGPLEGRGFTHFMHLPYNSSRDGEGGYLTGDEGAVTSMGTRVGNVAQPRAEFHGLEKKDGVSGAGSTFGGGFNVPGLASNASNVSIGQSMGGHGAQAAAMAAEHGYGAQADAFLNTRNPFVGPGTVRSTLGDPLSAHIVGLSRQLEEQLGRGGITAQVEDALNSSTPNWDVWLKVSPETIEAFNRLGEAEADRENSTYAVADAERDLAEARKELEEVTEGDVELSTSMARKIADAEEALTKARAGGKADKIADAEKKLARAREDANAELEKAGVKNAEEAQKATENLGKAQAKLTQEREKEERAIAELQAAQVQYQIAMAVAPVDAFMGIADVAVAGIEKLADSFQKLDAVIQSTNEVVERHGDAQIRAAEAGYDAITASQRAVRQERQAREQRHADILAVQAAEFDLGMTRHEASKVAGAAEVDLSAIRQQGIWDVYQTSAVADQQAILSASQVAMMESALAVARAQAAYSDQQLTYESAMAQLDLEFAQRNAEIQAKALGIATRELAAIQGEAAGIAGYGASAMAKKTEGTATKAGGVMGLLGSIAKVGVGLALAAPTGGASLLLTAQGLAEGIGHVGSISRGHAQEKAWAEEAQKEFDALPDDVKAMIVAQQAGIPLAAAAGALMGAAGGSRDDVKMVQESVQGAFSVGLDVAIAKAEAELAAAEAQRQREERELAVLERQNRLDEINARLTLDQEAFNQENYLAELLAVAKEQHAELQQENKQLGQIHDAVSPKNQAVLMSIGGSGWGGDTGGASVADLRGGFGGLTGDMLNPYGSVGMEDQWSDADGRARMVAPWLPSEEEWLAALGPIKDLPETVGDKLYMDTVGEVVVPAGPTPSEEARAQQMAESLSRAVADILLTQQGTNVETQFTGDVTISGAQATDTINALAEHLARA